MDGLLDNISNRARSILSFCHDEVNWFIKFKMLRVLDLSNSSLCFNECNLLFTDIGVGLVLLRYLALNINSLGPRLEMWMLKENFNLQTLLLLTDKERKGYYTTKVCEIWRMLPMLRHLQFSPVFTLDTLMVDFEYLQTIYWLRPFQCTKQVFLRIPNTKVMGIFIPNEDFLSTLARVRRLNEFFEPSDDCFKSWPDDDYRDHLRLNWLKDLINLKKLEKLKINSDHNDPIILPHASAFTVQLRMLTLKGTLLSWRQVEEVIGKLPNLRVLKLKDGACRGLHWELFGGNFPKLKSLLIQGMELKKWTATEDAFTILERLIIKHCYNLKKIPSTFAELYTLRLIELYSCDSLLVHSAKQIQQLQQESIGDNLFGVHDYNTDKAAASIEEKEQVKRGNFEEQERKKKEAEAVEGLHRRLAQLLDFLDNDSENQLNDDDETTKEWKGRLKEVALRIEDDIESEIIYRYGREQPRWPLIGRLRNQKIGHRHHSAASKLRSTTMLLAIKSLRVLDLGSLHNIDDMPYSYVADLILLRYLALRPSRFLSSLPVFKDWNLQTLVLLENWGGSTSAYPKPLISEIWELPKLRHLQVCTTFVFGTPTVVHQYLQTVQWLRPFQCTEQVFLRIPNAKVMGIFMEGSVESGEPNCLDNLRCLNQLEELKIESRHNPVFLPVVDAFPAQLKKLKLKGTLVPWDAMRVIGMLPNLQVLQLKNGACQGEYWELTEDGFRQLKSLLIYGSDLRHWEATGDGFPVLERLILKECYELEGIPYSFVDILTLQLIELCHCYSRLVNSAEEIQKEQRYYGNDGLVVRAYNIWIGSRRLFPEAAMQILGYKSHHSLRVFLLLDPSSIYRLSQRSSSNTLEKSHPLIWDPPFDPPSVSDNISDPTLLNSPFLSLDDEEPSLPLIRTAADTAGNMSQDILVKLGVKFPTLRRRKIKIPKIVIATIPPPTMAPPTTTVRLFFFRGGGGGEDCFAGSDVDIQMHRIISITDDILIIGIPRPVHPGIINRRKSLSPNIQPVQSLKSGVVEDVKVIGSRDPFYRVVVDSGGFALHVIACRNRNNFNPVHECIRAGRGGEGYVELLIVIHVNDILFLDQRVYGCEIGAEVTQQGILISYD
nr:putative late blight resistance protein homolog R1B-23 [Ipomoea trifida]